MSHANSVKNLVSGTQICITNDDVDGNIKVHVGRILHKPVLNYGFSGDCLMQLPVAEQLGTAKFNGAAPHAVVVDCLPNMQQDTPGVVSNDTIAVLAVLETKFPNVPILIIDGQEYTNNWIKTAQKINQDALAAAQR